METPITPVRRLLRVRDVCALVGVARKSVPRHLDDEGSAFAGSRHDERGACDHSGALLGVGVLCEVAARVVDEELERKELGVLQAALNYCQAEGYLTSAPKVRLPAKPAPRDRWLTRDEAARLLWAAYRNPKARHLSRFILVALYTGTRSEAILGLRFMPHTAGGHVDTEAGRIYRRGAGQTETKKRQPPTPIPNKLRAHLRRWERNGARFVVDVDGQRVGSVKTAWRTALTEAGIEHCTRHDLRHTAITWAMQRGIDKWTAAGFFGVTLEVLEGTYGHHHPDYLQGAVEAMDRRA